MMRDGEENWQEYVGRMSTIDWRRSAPIWRGNVVSEDGDRVLTAHKSVGAGVLALKSRIGWSSNAGQAVETADDVDIDVAA